MAEGEGFEPSTRMLPGYGLAGRCITTLPPFHIGGGRGIRTPTSVTTFGFQNRCRYPESFGLCLRIKLIRYSIAG